MTKRHKFIITSVLLSLGFTILGATSGSSTLLGISLLSWLSLLLFFWSLRESLGRDATLLVLILPPLFTLGVGIFWFLLPATFIARAPITLLYGIGIYALALTSNIFTISAIRTIALLRAAKGVGFVLTLFTSFLLYDAILSLRSDIWISASLVFVSSFPLYLQGLWTSKLDRQFPTVLIFYALVGSYIEAAQAILLFFWPVSVVIGSLFLTLGMYEFLGLSQSKLEGRLFQQIVREYLFVGSIGLIVFLGTFFITSWRG